MWAQAACSLPLAFALGFVRGSLHVPFAVCLERFSGSVFIVAFARARQGLPKGKTGTSVASTEPGAHMALSNRSENGEVGLAGALPACLAASPRESAERIGCGSRVLSRFYHKTYIFNYYT